MGESRVGGEDAQFLGGRDARESATDPHGLERVPVGVGSGVMIPSNPGKQFRADGGCYRTPGHAGCEQLLARHDTAEPVVADSFSVHILQLAVLRPPAAVPFRICGLRSSLNPCAQLLQILEGAALVPGMTGRGVRGDAKRRTYAPVVAKRWLRADSYAAAPRPATNTSRGGAPGIHRGEASPVVHNSCRKHSECCATALVRGLRAFAAVCAGVMRTGGAETGAAEVDGGGIRSS